MQLRVYVTPNGTMPFARQFHELDRDAQDAVARRLSHDLALLEETGVNPGKKLNGWNVWQTGSARTHGNATRVLYRRANGAFVVFGVFSKSQNADNTAALRRSARDVSDFDSSLAVDPDALDDFCYPLVLREDHNRPGNWRAFSTDDQNAGIRFAPAVTEVSPQGDTDGGWKEDRRHAENERDSARVESEEQLKLLDEGTTALAAHSQRRAQHRMSRRVAELESRSLRQWREPPFDLQKLLDWMALDEEEVYLREIGLSQEAARNVQAEEDFTRWRTEELAALDRGEEELTSLPDNADEARAAASRTIDDDVAEFTRLQQEWMVSAHSAAQRQAANNGRRGNDRGPGQTFLNAPPELRAMHRQILNRIADYTRLEDIRKRIDVVRNEVFSPSRRVERRLRNIAERTAARRQSIGAGVLASGYPAIVAALGLSLERAESARKGQGKKKVKNTPQATAKTPSTKEAIAALVARVAYEHGLDLDAELFGGITLDHLADESVRKAIAGVASYQQRQRIPVGTGMTNDAAEIAREPELLAELEIVTAAPIIEPDFGDDDDDLGGPIDPDPTPTPLDSPTGSTAPVPSTLESVQIGSGAGDSPESAPGPDVLTQLRDAFDRAGIQSYKMPTHDDGTVPIGVARSDAPAAAVILAQLMSVGDDRDVADRLYRIQGRPRGRLVDHYADTTRLYGGKISNGLDVAVVDVGVVNDSMFVGPPQVARHELPQLGWAHEHLAQMHPSEPPISRATARFLDRLVLTAIKDPEFRLSFDGGRTMTPVIEKLDELIALAMAEHLMHWDGYTEEQRTNPAGIGTLVKCVLSSPVYTKSLHAVPLGGGAHLLEDLHDLSVEGDEVPSVRAAVEAALDDPEVRVMLPADSNRLMRSNEVLKWITAVVGTNAVVEPVHIDAGATFANGERTTHTPVSVDDHEVDWLAAISVSRITVQPKFHGERGLVDRVASDSAEAGGLQLAMRSTRYARTLARDSSANSILSQVAAGAQDPDMARLVRTTPTGFYASVEPEPVQVIASPPTVSSPTYEAFPDLPQTEEEQLAWSHLAEGVEIGSEPDVTTAARSDDPITDMPSALYGSTTAEIDGHTVVDGGDRGISNEVDRDESFTIGAMTERDNDADRGRRVSEAGQRLERSLERLPASSAPIEPLPFPDPTTVDSSDPDEMSAFFMRWQAAHWSRNIRRGPEDEGGIAGAAGGGPTPPQDDLPSDSSTAATPERSQGEVGGRTQSGRRGATRPTQSDRSSQAETPQREQRSRAPRAVLPSPPHSAEPAPREQPATPTQRVSPPPRATLAGPTPQTETPVTPAREGRITPTTSRNAGSPASGAGMSL